MKKLQIRFLGTSSGESIPRDDECAQCASTDKRDKRLRPSILVNKKILVDAGQDVLKQLTRSQILSLEAVLITHDHADHVAGLKDLIKVSRDIRIIKLQPGQHFKLIGIDFYAFRVRHSNMLPTVGVEIEGVIYIPDYSDLDLAIKYLKESNVAVLDGSVMGRSQSGHMAINETVNIVKGFQNLEKIYFTHNGHTHRTHKEMQKYVQELGDKRFNVAYDRLEIEL